MNSIEKEKTYLTCIDTLPVDYPMIDKVDSVYKEYPYANAIYMYGIGEMKEIPFMLPMTNNKLCMVDELEERFKTTNSYLTKLGLTDNLFRDGMSVGELEEYFDLVTDKNTFAPLFE